MAGRVVGRRRCLIVDANGDPRRHGQPCDEGGRHEAGHGPRGEHGARRRHEQDARRDERAEHETGAFDCAGEPVRGREFLGRAGHAREQSALGRAGDGQRGRDRCRAEVDERGRSPDDHRDHRRAVRDRLDEVADEQDALASETVAEVRGERRDDRGRQQLDQGDDAHTGRPGGRVGEERIATQVPNSAALNRRKAISTRRSAGLRRTARTTRDDSASRVRTPSSRIRESVRAGNPGDTKQARRQGGPTSWADTRSPDRARVLAGQIASAGRREKIRRRPGSAPRRGSSR